MNDPNDHDNEIVYIGFWLRFAAFIIDSFVVTALVVPLLLLLYGKGLFAIDIDPNVEIMLRNMVPEFGEFIIKYVLPAIAIVLFWIFKSATPGKMAVSAEIVDAKTFGKPTAKQLIIRYLGYYVSMLPFCLGMLWIAFDKRKQGWHDKLARTVVIDKHSKPQC